VNNSRTHQVVVSCGFERCKVVLKKNLLDRTSNDSNFYFDRIGTFL
jgi:hypothetical protein